MSSRAINRIRLTAAVVVLVAAVTGCGGGADDPPAALAESPQVEASFSPSTSAAPAEEGHPTTTPVPSPTPTATSGRLGDASAMAAGEQLFLARESVLLEEGNGEQVDCPGNLDKIPRPSAASPAVWLDVPKDVGPVALTNHVALCLYGFDPSAPIDLTVATGGFRAHTRAGTNLGSRGRYEDFLDPRTLFTDGADLRLVTDHDQFLTAGLWALMPPQSARELMAVSGSFQITARQGTTQATYTQAFNLSTAPRMDVLWGLPPSDVRIVVLGYKPGTPVPFGMYRVRSSRTKLAEEGSEWRADQVEQIGTATTDRAWAAEYTVSTDLLLRYPPDHYCISASVGRAAYCARTTGWDPYPGKARPGDQGDTVNAWRHILLKAGEMGPGEERSDEGYSPRIEAVIRRLQESWGWQPDGIAGPATYARLTGLPRPTEPPPGP